MIAIFGIVILALIYKAIIPPSPKICGSPNGPLITAPRIKLSDGRYLAYKENGVPRDEAKHKFVFIHGFDCVRHDVALLTTISPVCIIFTLFPFIPFFELFYCVRPYLF